MFVIARILESLIELSKILDYRLSITEAVIEVFLEIAVRFMTDVLLNIVLLRSS